jgi:hypothetical protein
MSGDTGADLVVVALTGVFVLLHEFRASRRDDGRKADHATAIKEIRDARATFLGARHEVDCIRADVVDLKTRAKDLDERLLVLEQGTP